MIGGKNLSLGIRLVLGGIFIYASLDKIAHPNDFAGIILNYQILPEVLINPAAIILPWLEVFLGLLLVSGRWLPGAVGLCNLLLLIFFGALLYNLFRGIDTECGCFTTQSSGSASALRYVIRDLFFLVLSFFLFFQVAHSRRENMAARR